MLGGCGATKTHMCISCKIIQICWKIVKQFLITLTINNSSLMHLSKRNIYICSQKKKLHERIFIVFLFIIAKKMETAPMLINIKTGKLWFIHIKRYYPEKNY